MSPRELPRVRQGRVAERAASYSGDLLRPVDHERVVRVAG